MEQKWLKLALAGGAFAMSAMAYAETSVTLYGVVDEGISYTQVRGGSGKRSRFGLSNGLASGSLWGLKGTEDLGDGLQATFQLESGFDARTGYSQQDDRLFGRQATVGLRSDSWGRIDLGRQTNIASKYFANVASPFGYNYGQASVGTAFSSANELRYDNMVMYQTPNFSGFQAGIGYSFNASGSQEFRHSGDGEPNTRALTAGVRYDNGPLGAALVYDQFKTADNGPVIGEHGINVRSLDLALSYDFDVVKLYAAYGQTRNGWFSGPNIGDSVPSNMWARSGLRVNSYTVGASVPVTSNGKLMASWTMADPNDDSYTQHVYSLGYDYSLSKRTDLYAMASYAHHVLFQPEGSMKAATAGVGIRHQF
ncbi:porin [Candidimonas humi]|jgi:predicted porin|uniref:Porin n=1 Tax=Candidimonas humi TaxID=683355 RepID=A0ABV8P1S2_9BURK|nr:porin [Candidimonas humi]MBV6306982.1 porin [Candidimonas humi]